MSFKHMFVIHANRILFIGLVISFIFAGINVFSNPAGVLAGIPAGFFCLSLGYFVGAFVSFIRVEEHGKLRIERLEEKAEKDPKNSRYAWDVARIRLEAYFDRNLV